MPLDDLSARAMIVKTLTDEELSRVHAIEEREGRYLFPFEIVRLRRTVKSTGEYWGIPEDADARRMHAERIQNQVRRFIVNRRLSANLGDPTSRREFDWAVMRSRPTEEDPKGGITFHFQAGGGTLAEKLRDDRNVF